MNRTIFLSPVILLMLSTASWGLDDKSNDCARLHVQIGNATSSACKLVKTKVIHGQLISSAPAMLPSGFSGRFDIKQTVYGPDIVLEYECNGERVTFESQQNYCFVKSGKIHGKVIATQGNVNAHYTAEEGSYYWGKPGLINWVIGVP